MSWCEEWKTGATTTKIQKYNKKKIEMMKIYSLKNRRRVPDVVFEFVLVATQLIVSLLRLLCVQNHLKGSTNEIRISWYGKSGPGSEKIKNLGKESWKKICVMSKKSTQKCL